MIKTAVIRKIPENNNKIKLILFSILLFCIVMLVLSNECIIDEPIINKTNIMLILSMFSKRIFFQSCINHSLNS